MGVKGLLPCLQSITRQVTLDKYRGLSVAIDAMCWLHKGIFTGNVTALAKYQFLEEQYQQQQEDEEVENDESTYRINNDRIETKNTKHNNCVLASTAKRLNFDRFTTTATTSTTTITSNNYSQKNMKRRISKPSEQVNNIDAMEAMSKCIDYVIRHAIEIQTEYGMDIILVIDGDSLPSKQSVNEKRRMDRVEAFRRGLNAEKRGDNRQARKFFSRACSITYEMRHELIIKCKQSQIPFIVAPYEADAQMAKLALTGEVDLVITEDSDMLAYGCPRVLFKLDFKGGIGEEIQLMKDLAFNEPLSFRHWNHDMFVYMCILAGCDYCEGVTGVGIQSAHKIVRIHRKPKKIIESLIRDGKVEDTFEASFHRAYKTFRHQRVFCSQKREATFLFEMKGVGVDVDESSLDFLGPSLEPTVAIGIAEGMLHPREKKPWEQVKVKSYNFQMKLSALVDSNASTYKSQERKRLPTERSPNGKENVCTKLQSGNSSSPSSKKMFAFFRPKKRNNNSRPPLQEVHISKNTEQNRTSVRTDKSYVINLSRYTGTVPSNYHDYNSHLVSGNFEPISRNNNHNRLLPRRKAGVSKALRELKLKLSSKATKKESSSRSIASKENLSINEHEEMRLPNHMKGLNRFRKAAFVNLPRAQDDNNGHSDYLYQVYEDCLDSFDQDSVILFPDFDQSSTTKHKKSQLLISDKLQSTSFPFHNTTNNEHYDGIHKENKNYACLDYNAVTSSLGYNNQIQHHNQQKDQGIQTTSTAPRHDQHHRVINNYFQVSNTSNKPTSSLSGSKNSFCGFDECLPVLSSSSNYYEKEGEFYVNEKLTTLNKGDDYRYYNYHNHEYDAVDMDPTNYQCNNNESQTVFNTVANNKKADGLFEDLNHFFHF